MTTLAASAVTSLFFPKATPTVAVVSAGAEADFDLGYRVNLDAARLVFEACREQPRAPRLVFTSSVAAFGGDMPETITDATAATPQSS